MLTKAATERETAANFVHAAIDTHGEVIKQGIEARLEAERKPDEPPVPDTRQLVVLGGRRMMRLLAVLLAADLAHEQELLDDPGPRKRRDDAGSRLYRGAVELRQGAAWIYGSEAEAALGFSGATPEDPRVLVRQCKLALEQFDDAFADRPARAGFTWEVAAQKASLAALVAETEAALRDVEREVKEAEATLQAKYAAMDAFDAAFTEVASLISALLRLAGETALAERVRPSKKQRGRLMTDEERLTEGTPPV